ncbi:hypothetical protein JCM8097_005098 [Rhodosporidiobolus ruineniae]
MQQRQQRKRTNAGQACRACRDAKNRCLPGPESSSVCQRCERKGLECDWETGPDLRKVRSDTKAHVAGLEARIKELEAQLASTSLAPPTPAPDGPILHLTPSASTSAGLVSHVSTPVLDSLEPDADGKLRLYTGTNSFRGRPVEPPASLAPADYTFLPIPLTTELHSEILDLAFKYQFDAWVTVERDVFVANMGSGTRTRSYSPFLHLGVLAIGCRYLQDPPPFLCSDPSDPSTRGEPFIKAALDLLATEIISPKFSTIRGLMVIAQYLGANCKPHAGWVVFGIACRIAYDFGLTVDPPADSLIDPSLRECRTKLFWDVFTHDVGWCLFIGRSTYFSLVRIRQPLPFVASSSPLPPASARSPSESPASSSSTPPALSLWQLEISLHIIGSRILWLNYSDLVPRDALADADKDGTVRALLREMKEWYARLPGEEKKDGVVVQLPAMVQLHFNYYVLIILLFRPYLSSSAPQEMVRLAIEQIDRAAEKVVTLARLFEVEEKDEEGGPWCSSHLYQTLFHAGAVSLELSARLSPSSSSSSASAAHPDADTTFARLLARAETCIGFIAPHGRQWTSAERCRAVLVELRDAAVAEREKGGEAGTKKPGKGKGKERAEKRVPEKAVGRPPPNASAPQQAAPPPFSASNPQPLLHIPPNPPLSQQHQPLLPPQIQLPYPYPPIQLPQTYPTSSLLPTLPAQSFHTVDSSTSSSALVDESYLSLGDFTTTTSSGGMTGLEEGGAFGFSPLQFPFAYGGFAGDPGGTLGHGAAAGGSPADALGTAGGGSGWNGEWSFWAGGAGGAGGG